MVLPLDLCYDGCATGTTGSSRKCYFRDTADINPPCPSDSIQLGSRYCVPCPLGCAKCAGGLPDLNVICSSCSENYTLISASGVCGCINDYYFTIDPATKQGKCIAKQRLTATFSLNSQTDPVISCSIPESIFYFKESQVSTISPLISVYLQGVLLSPIASYTLKFNSSSQLVITIKLTANIERNSVLNVDFSKYNTIEGVPIMIVPANASYVIPQGFSYLSPETLQTISNIAQAATAGVFAQASSTSSFAILLGGASGAAVLLLDALSELEMYKYLNVNFPRNFIEFFDSLYSSSLIPNVYSYMHSDGPVATSAYYQFARWKTPVLFIEKYGDSFIKENIAFSLVIVTGFLQLLFRKTRKLNKTFTKIHYIFRWNLLFSFFLADLTPFLVQIALQFKEAPFITTDKYTIFSTSISVIVLISYAVIFATGLYQINRKRLEVPDYLSTAKRRLKEKLKKESYPKSLMVFKEEFKEDTAFDKNCLLIIKFEDVILSMNYIFMQEMPLAQCYIYTLVTGFWLLMIVVGNPLKSRIAMIIFVLNSAIKMILGIIAIVIATDELKVFLNQDSSLMIGSAMIWLIVINLGLNTIISVGIVVTSLYHVGKVCCRGAKKKVKKRYNIQLQESNLNDYSSNR